MSVEVLVSVVVVTGVLIFFLQNDMAFMFGLHSCRFLVTEYTEAEIYARYPQHVARYEAALAANYFEKVRVDNPDAVQAFAKFKAARCLSTAECDVLAASIQEKAPIMARDTAVIKLMRGIIANVEIFMPKQMVSELNAKLTDSNKTQFSPYFNMLAA